MERQTTLKVTPVHRIHKYKAPYYYVEIPDGATGDEVEQLIRQPSGLARFESWSFQTQTARYWK